MKNLKDKETFIVIAILLVLIFPLAFIGTLQKIKINKTGKSTSQTGDGSLYFYDENNLYMGKYQCVLEKCAFATSSEESEVINHYTGMKETLGTINGKYAFIKDNKLVLYSIDNDKVMSEFEEIKFYNTTLENDLLLVKKDKKWGVMLLSNISMALDYKYDYLGLTHRLNENEELRTDIFIAKIGDKYMLIDNEGKELSASFDHLIYDYNDKFLVLKKNRTEIYLHDGTRMLDNKNIFSHYFYNNHIIVYHDNMLNLYDNLSQPPLETKEPSEGSTTFNIGGEEVKFMMEGYTIKLVEER